MRKSILGVNANSKDPEKPTEIHSLIRNFAILRCFFFYITQSFSKRTVKVLSEQTLLMCSLSCDFFSCPHMPEDTCSLGAAHVTRFVQKGKSQMQVRTT